MSKIVIALPGRSFSGAFLKNWTATIMTLSGRGYQLAMINEYSSFVSFSRMKTLGLDVLRGSEQKPFNEKLEYDVWLTIDSDIVFTPEQVIELIEDTKKYPVVSGLYMMQDMKHFACVKEWNTDYFKKTGSFKFLRRDDIEGSSKHISVAYNGMGFFACRKGVIEKLKYPYFSYPLIEIEAEDGTTLRDMCSEDVAFCKNLTDAGFDIIVNTNLRVGHEKTLVI
jgi:hypothetical protein